MIMAAVGAEGIENLDFSPDQCSIAAVALIYERCTTDSLQDHKVKVGGEMLVASTHFYSGEAAWVRCY